MYKNKEKKIDFHCDPYRNDEEVRKQRNKKMESGVFLIEEEKYGNKKNKETDKYIAKFQNLFNFNCNVSCGSICGGYVFN